MLHCQFANICQNWLTIFETVVTYSLITAPYSMPVYPRSWKSYNFRPHISQAREENGGKKIKVWKKRKNAERASGAAQGQLGTPALPSSNKSALSKRQQKVQWQYQQHLSKTLEMFNKYISFVKIRKKRPKHQRSQMYCNHDVYFISNLPPYGPSTSRAAGINAPSLQISLKFID